jgi:N-acyl-D-amino-acid deacylase
VAPGLVANLVAFDPARVQDRATYEEPTLRCEGVEVVVVNGKVAVEGGTVIAPNLGRVIRRR